MRIKNSIRNTGFALSGQIFGMVLSFVNRTIFIYILGAEYLGINGLFTNILSILSLAELGVGGAIIYSLYKPLANNDVRKIKALMNLYAKLYRIIGCIVCILGLALLPFLDILIKDKPEIPNLDIIYLIYLANSVITYFYAYKRSIIVADQKGHINTVNQYIFYSIQTILQIIILITTNNFLLYLVVQFICVLCENIMISVKANRLFPFLTDGKKEHLEKKEKKSIFKNMVAMFYHKIGAAVVLGTDNLLISAYIGVYWVGIYSNYVMIIGMINNLLKQIFNSINASIGHLNATESDEKSYTVFNSLFLMNFWIYGFCAITLWVLINPFINMWIGENYILDKGIVLVIVINFFIGGMRQITLNYTDTTGLFWNSRYKPLFESLINLVSSIILLNYYGIIGVLLGTLISTMTTSFWVEPYVIYKHKFKKPTYIYFFKYFKYTIILIGAGFITDFICSPFSTNTFSSIVSILILCMLVSNSLFLLFFYKTPEFKYLKNVFMQLMKKMAKRNEKLD